MGEREPFDTEGPQESAGGIDRCDRNHKPARDSGPLGQGNG